jgi:hypothetical protein
MYSKMAAWLISGEDWMRKLRTPEDIQALPGYMDKVDPKLTPLSHIIEFYYIRPFQIQCGLCGKFHMEGCIVKLENGAITNIGHICGDRFGEKYALEKAKFSETTRKPSLIKKMTEISAKLSALHFHLEDQKYQLRATIRRKENFFKLVPTLRSELVRRAMNNQAQVFKSIELSGTEIEEAKAAQPHIPREELRYRQQLVGTIRGYRLPSLDSGMNKFFSEVAQFTELNPRGMSMPELSRWSNWGDDMDDTLAAIRNAINEGEEFFSKENLELIQCLPMTSDVLKKLKNLTLSALDAATVSDGSQPSSPPQSRKRALKALPTKPSPRELRRLIGDKKVWR